MYIVHKRCIKGVENTKTSLCRRHTTGVSPHKAATTTFAVAHHVSRPKASETIAHITCQLHSLETKNVLSSMVAVGF